MKAILLSLLIFVVRINVSGQKNNIGQRVEGFAGHPLEIVEADGYRLPVYDFDGIKSILYMKGDTTYVVNFWATWCKPCVQELPGFLDLSKELEGDKVRFFFVSLDFRKNAVNSVIPFLKSKEMNQGVMILDDPDANHWINQVDSDKKDSG